MKLRLTWLLVVMFLDVSFSTIKELLGNYLVDVFSELLSLVNHCHHGSTFLLHVASC